MTGPFISYLSINIFDFQILEDFTFKDISMNNWFFLYNKMEFFKNYGNESTDEDSEMSTEEVEDYGNSDNGVLRKGI